MGCDISRLQDEDVWVSGEKFNVTNHPAEQMYALRPSHYAEIDALRVISYGATVQVGCRDGQKRLAVDNEPLSDLPLVFEYTCLEGADGGTYDVELFPKLHCVN